MPHHLEYQKKADRLLQISVKHLLHALPQFVFLKDVNSIYLGCNAHFARLLGLSSSEDIIGKTDLDLRWQPAGHTAEDFRRADQDTLHGHPVTNQQETLVLPNGKKLITLVSKLPIEDEDHTILGLVGYFSDITALKEQERELKHAKQQAEAANRAKSIFITNISHDIRTPLTGIIGAAQLMAQPDAPKNQAITTDLIQAAEGLLQFLNQVIDFSKWESGDLPIYHTKFNIRELVDHVLGLFRVAAQEKALKFQGHVDEQLPLYWIGDRLRLQRILLNLVSNAVKFTAQGSVDVTVSLAGKQRRKHILQMVVQDTGVGIPPELQPLIFTRFSRLHPAYEGRYPGAGLSLALVKRMIDELGGEIYVDSAEHQGSTFTCLIPLRPALLPDARYVSHPPPAKKPAADATLRLTAVQPTLSSPLHRQTLLLVEDNPLVQLAVKSQLETLKVAVDTADQGTEALLKIKTVDYAGIIMDLGLPDQDGCTVTQAIHAWQRRHNRPLSPVVALSAHLVDETQRQRCLAVGMIDAFTKPLDDAKLQRLAELLQQYAADTRNRV
jgi:two-component system, OmpR family, aerobic respiration control sensor histidine kinase ArcB